MKLLKLSVCVLALMALGVFAYGLARPAPLVPALEVRSLTGEAVTMQGLRGKVLVVSFWSTTCGICLREMPELVARHNAFAAQGYETLAIASHKDDLARVRELAARKKLPYTIAFDADARASQAFGDVRLTPTTFIVDRQGRILKRYVGRTPWREFDALVRRALKNNI